ncbi:hypothetical protein B0H19DRAFT_1239177 [Mycena capillaripes]|nr:hypothetical protein B0H19DRAFT_1239177 [Mycena capillaripes]
MPTATCFLILSTRPTTPPLPFAVAQTTPTVEVFSQTLTPVDYNIMGNIVSPIPAKGKSIAVTGSLTSLERNDDKSEQHFVIDIDNVTFLGPQGGSTAPKAEESPTKIAQVTPARLKFTGFGSQGSSWEEPAQKKRKTTDDRTLEEADAKGEGPLTGRSSRRAPRD